MKTLVLTTDQEVVNERLPLIDELIIPLVKQGTGDTVTEINVGIKLKTSVRVVGAKIFTTSDATGDGLNYLELTLPSPKKFFIKAIESDAFMAFRTATSIDSFGTSGGVFAKGFGAADDDGNMNGTVPVVNIDKIPTSLVNLNMGAATILHGDINGLKRAPLLNPVNMRQSALTISRSHFGGVLTGILGSGNTGSLLTSNFDIEPARYTYVPISAFSKGRRGITMRASFVKNVGFFGGELKDLPSNVTTFDGFDGTSMQAVTGTLSDLATRTSLDSIMMYKNTNVSGNLNELPQSVTRVILKDNNAIQYPGTKTWGNNMREVDIPNSLLSTSQIDQLLMDLNAASWSSTYPTPKRVNLKGTPSSASTSAIAGLRAKGVVVTITP